MVDGTHHSNVEEYWNNVDSSSKNQELSLDPIFRRFNGCYFTGLELAKDMVDHLFESMDDNQLKNIDSLKFLEPCVGTGNFVLSYLMKIYELHLSDAQNRSIVNNIYVADVSADLLTYYSRVLNEFVKVAFGFELNEDYFDTHTHLGLLYDINSKNPEYISISEAFPGQPPFDIILTNPPYKNLKAEADQFETKEEYQETKQLYAELKKTMNKTLKYSVTGVLNIYKLFVEEIVEKYAAPNALISLLIPNSILSDKSCEKLRKRIIDTCKLIRIEVIREDSTYVDAQQALCTFLIKKGAKNDTFVINKDYCADKSNLTRIDVKDIATDSYSIIAVNEAEYQFLKKLRRFPQLSSYKYIHNLRGELDLTQFRDYITEDSTQMPLLRGKHISKYFIKEQNPEFASRSFLDVCTKVGFLSKPRIACQQISNMLSEERVNYAYVPDGYVLGNSCNFISIDDNKDDIDLFYLLGLLNSSVINWYFKITSSNNHINNYEIDAFPVPNNPEYTKLISDKVKMYLETRNTELITEIDNLVKQSFEKIPKGVPKQVTLDGLEF